MIPITRLRPSSTASIVTAFAFDSPSDLCYATFSLRVDFMNMSVSAGRGTFAFEKVRVMRICNELAPGKQVRFSDSRILINFYIRDEFSGVNLIEGSGDWVPGELGDKSDDDLRDLVKRLSNGKIT
jgi:hypothetical protein